MPLGEGDTVEETSSSYSVVKGRSRYYSPVPGPFPFPKNQSRRAVEARTQLFEEIKVKSLPQFDLIQFLKEAHRQGIRYLLIGRWALAQHGAPVVTAGYDFWIHPEDRTLTFRLLEKLFDAELPAEDKRNKPMVTAYVGPDKLDFFKSAISIHNSV